MKIVITLYYDNIAEENAEYVKEVLKSNTIKKKNIKLRYLIAKEKDDSSNNIQITFFANIEIDKDEDGIHIDNDNCPNTPLGERVGVDGCNLDSFYLIFNKKDKMFQVVSDTTKVKKTQIASRLYYTDSGLSEDSKENLEKIILDFHKNNQ